MVDCVTAMRCGGVRLRGRPKPISEDERRGRLIQAAEDVFLERGYGLATMDDVSRRAGMSKKTIYQLFATKQALFAALLAQNVERLMMPIKTDDGTRGPRAVLEDFLRQVARFVLSPRQVAMHRLVISEALRTPELAQAFLHETMDRGRSELVQWFEGQRQRGTLNIEDADEAASILCGFVISEPQLRLLYGQDEPPTWAMIDRRVQLGLDIFFKGTSV
ncbi:MAG TPA: TetR/AcrR family transcriptional regulator [Aliidongia sp.]|nr:TetR/AcrR family transcriptional regulator [Aliidongia sp.]